MNTQKNVFNKISKITKEVELSEVQKVELALVDDFISEVNEANAKSDLAIDKVIGVKKVLMKSKSELNEVKKSLKILKTGQGRIRKMYAELGVEPDAKLDFAFKKRLNVEFEVEELLKKINGLIGMI